MAEKIYYSEPVSFMPAPSGAPGPAGRGIQSIKTEYCRTEDRLQPTSGWSEVLDTDTTKPYLWIKTTYTYTSGEPISEVFYSLIANGEKGDDGATTNIVGSYDTFEALNAAKPNGPDNPGDAYLVGGDLYTWKENTWTKVGNLQGPAGPAGEGINYRLNLTPSAVMKGLTHTFNTEEIEISLESYGKEEQLFVLNENNYVIAQLYLMGAETTIIEVPIGAISYNTDKTIMKINLTYGTFDFDLSDYDGIILKAYIDKKLTISHTIPFELSKELFQLANIDKNSGEVRIADGKVYASSIVSNSITANEIATGAITANKIAVNAITASKINAGEITSDHISTNGLTSKGGYTFDGNSQYTKTGSVISFHGLLGSSLHFKNFYIDKDGNAGFRGTINAVGALLGGWQIKEKEITDIDNNVGLYSGSEKTKQSLVNTALTSPIRFYAGPRNNDYIFAILQDGSLYSSAAKMNNIELVSGRISNLLRIGNNTTGIVLDGTNGNIHTQNYTSGSLGYGWNIEQNGRAQFGDIYARGKLSSVVFEQQTISSVGGSLYISPTIYFQNSTSQLAMNENNWQITYTGDWSNTDFIKGVAVKLSFILHKNSSNEDITYNDIDATIINNENNNIVISIIKTDYPALSFVANDIIQPGCIMTFIGTSTQKKYLYLTASDAGAPFIDVQDFTVDSGEQMIPKVRLGNLSGIVDSDFTGTVNGNLTGYGLYSSAAYLKGQLMLPNAGITNQTEITYNSSGNEGDQIRFWAGPHNGGIQNSPFIVTHDGSLYAKKGIFEGEIRATDGVFTGAIQAAGVIIDNYRTDGQESPYSHFYVGYKKETETSLLNNDDYVLNINKDGLSIWEGGLRAYSDYASGWEGEVKPTNPTIIQPYGSADNTKTPYPYFSLIDNMRATMKTAHILDIYKNGDKYDGRSIYLNKKGLQFVSHSNLDISQDFENLENQAYNGLSASSIYSDINNNLVIKDTVKLTLDAPQINLVNSITGRAGELDFNLHTKIVEAYKNGGSSIGLNFIITE